MKPDELVAQTSKTKGGRYQAHFAENVTLVPATPHSAQHGHQMSPLHRANLEGSPEPTPPPVTSSEDESTLPMMQMNHPGKF